jgi:hypothetical protein
LGGNRVGAGIVLAAGALTVTDALAVTRSEADGIQVIAPEGKNGPSTTLDLSVPGGDGKSIDLKADTDARGKLLRWLHHYFGADERERFLDIHPTPGNDSGIAVDQGQWFHQAEIRAAAQSYPSQ